MYYGSGLGRFTFLVLCIMGVCVIIARNCWIGLQTESYDKRSYRTNLIGLWVSIGILAIGLLIGFGWFNFLFSMRD